MLSPSIDIRSTTIGTVKGNLHISLPVHLVRRTHLKEQRSISSQLSLSSSPHGIRIWALCPEPAWGMRYDSPFTGLWLPRLTSNLSHDDDSSGGKGLVILFSIYPSAPSTVKDLEWVHGLSIGKTGASEYR